MSAIEATTSGAAYTVRPVRAWTKPGASSVAAHCSPYGDGWTLTVQGFRVYRPDGAAYRPSVAPYATQEEADAVAYRLNAPCVATVDAMAEENRTSGRPDPELAEWLADMRADLVEGSQAEREAAAREVRAVYVAGLPIGATGAYQAEGGPLPVVTTGHATTYAGKGPGDCTAWDAVPVRFFPVHGFGVVDVDAVAWDAVRI